MLYGTIYHSDGGRAVKDFPVKLEYEGQTYQGTLKNGKFELPAKLDRWPRQFRLYVGSSSVPERSVIRIVQNAVVVLPSHYGKSNNLDAGVITGTVVQSGDGMPHCKVQASVKGNGVLSFLSSPVAEAKTSRKGKFALEVEGGYQVKDLTVDGKEPRSLSVRGAEGEKEIESRLIRIGTFRLMVERKAGVLGL